VSPQIPGNTGTIARTCAATQVPLHLVGPLGFTLEDAQLKRAGLDYWSSVCVRVHADWEAFHVYWRHERGAPGRGLPDFARHVIGYRFTQACMSLDDAAGTFCSVLPRGASWPSPSSARGRTRRRGRTAPVTGRGLHSFRFQLHLSACVHRVTHLNPECVLELLKLSSIVVECKPLVTGYCSGRRPRGCRTRCTMCARRRAASGAFRSTRRTCGA